MRFVFCLLIISCSAASFAQEDIPTFHNKLETFAKIREPEVRADLASFTLGGLVESVGKQPLPYIPVSNYSDDSIQFAQNNIQVKITSGKFDPAKHKIQYYDEKYVVRVDNKPFYGIEGQMPKKTIESIIAVIGADTIRIPRTAFFDLYEPRFCSSDQGKVSCNTRVYLSNDKRRIYIYMLNSSGKGGYEVTWVIQDKKYLRRVIDYEF